MSPTKKMMQKNEIRDISDGEVRTQIYDIGNNDPHEKETEEYIYGIMSLIQMLLLVDMSKNEIKHD